MKVPKHLGIIPDGNRRFAKRLMLDPTKGPEFGVKTFAKICDWCREYGINEVTFWAFSIQNMSRPKAEFDYIMNLFQKEFSDMKNRDDIVKNKICVRFIGNIELLPDFVQKATKELEEATKDHDKFKVNIALAYGGRAELVTAVKRISEKINTGEIKAEDITEDLITNSLDQTGEIDYVIRTGGEHRTSGFFIWQTDYAEYCFIDKFFPELEKEDFAKAIESFSERDRRFGK